MTQHTLSSLGLGMAGLLLAVAAQADDTHALRVSCESLTSFQVAASKIALPSGAASIDSAQLQAAAPLTVAERYGTPSGAINPATPEFCKVVGHIAPLDAKAPNIVFEVNLPMQWNGRSVQYGGGGFNGTLITGLGLLPAARLDDAAPVALGYVTMGTDSGHQNKPNEAIQAFALNDEAFENFTHAAYKKLHDVAAALVQHAYGRSTDFAYYFGSSEGGREALTMAQRYPKDYQGIFARVPVINWTGLIHSSFRSGLATQGEAWLDRPQVELVHQAVLKTCDELDGLKDQLVANPVACRAKFDVTQLQCPAGATPQEQACLSAAQVKAVQTLHSAYRFEGFDMANGINDYPGWGVSGEAAAPMGPTGGWRSWFVGTRAPSVPAHPENGIVWFFGSGAMQYVFARDPNLDVRQYRPANYKARIEQVSQLMDSTNPNLKAFQDAGGKLIVLENMADYAQSPYAGIRYFEAVQKTLGKEQVAKFAKLYTAPGVDHVGAGAPEYFKVLQVLSAWTEKDQAPQNLQVVDQDPKAPFTPKRSLPLCEWPTWPKYLGTGDVTAASSFVCSQ